MYSKYLQYRYLEKVIRDCFNAQKMQMTIHCACYCF